MIIRRIVPLSAGKVAGVLYAGLGLIFGALFSVLAVAGAFATEDAGGAAFGAMFGIGAVVMLPILYGCMGFVMAVLMAWLYNLAASVTGGIELGAVTPPAPGTLPQ